MQLSQSEDTNEEATATSPLVVHFPVGKKAASFSGTAEHQKEIATRFFLSPMSRVAGGGTCGLYSPWCGGQAPGG